MEQQRIVDLPGHGGTFRIALTPETGESHCFFLQPPRIVPLGTERLRPLVQRLRQTIEDGADGPVDVHATSGVRPLLTFRDPACALYAAEHAAMLVLFWVRIEPRHLLGLLQLSHEQRRRWQRALAHAAVLAS